jgi:signal transduction histidine kinase
MRGASLAVLIALVLLGLTVLAKNSRKKSNLFFALLTFSAAGWVGSNLLVDLAGDSHNLSSALLWARLAIIGPTFVALFFLYFSRTFGRETRQSLLFYLLTAIPVLGVLALAPTSYSVTSVSLESWGVQVAPGLLYSLFTPFFGTYILWGIWNLIQARRRSGSANEKMQLNYLLSGIGVTIAVGLVTNLIFLQQGNGQLASAGPLSTIIFVGASAYAIIRHRLMDIRLVVARSIAYSLLVLILGALYTGGLFALQAVFFKESLGSGQIISSSILALLIAITAQPLKRILERVTDGIFFRDRYDQTELLARLSRVVSSTIILETLTKRVLTEVLESMRLEGGAIVVIDREEKLLIQNQNLLTKRLALADVESFFHRHSLTVFDDLPEGRKKALLRGLGVSVVVPLESREGVIGLILLGAKKSGDPFSESDLEVLEILAPELAVGIENARAYHQIERFNETLRLKVERATRKLREANSHLRELDKAKDEFISLASHQLRTPLTAIKGYLSMVADGDAGKLGAKQREFIEIAAGGAERMASLIDDLLNVSRMDAGRFLIERVPTDLSEMVEQEMRELATHASARHLLLTYHAPRTRVPILMLDSTKTRQVIINFIDNAIYYTKEGGVEVSLEKVGETVEFRVKDTGIGISPEDQQKLFTKFYRASNARDVRPDGTGLGLYLAKEVVESQGGEIICESKLGEGSTFGFRFKIPKRPRRSLTKPVVAAYHRRRAKHLV